MIKFRKNFHKAKKYSLSKVKTAIKNYPDKYLTPKYLIFVKTMVEHGWLVKIYMARVSKYIFVIKGEDIFKIRFSNHKPIYHKELEEDCDFYVGISHKQVSTIEKILKKILCQK